MGTTWGAHGESRARRARRIRWPGNVIPARHAHDVYAEARAPLAGCVLWTRSPTPVAARHRVLPDGCLDLIAVGGTILVAGPDTVAHLVEVAAGESYTGLRMGLGIGPE